MKEKIEFLVRKVVMEYLKKEKTSQVNKQILVILDDHPSIQTEDVWKQMKLLAKNYNITILHSSKWTNIPEDLKFVKYVTLHEEHLDEITKEMQKADVLFYATPSYATLAKLSLTMDDDFSSWITIQMQMDGKLIVLANDFVLPKGTKKITTPFTVSKRIQNYLRTLREDKVQFVALSQIDRWLESYFDSFTENRHIVLAKHIEEAAKLGESQLIVPKNSVITPMCKDYARELGVSIKQKE